MNFDELWLKFRFLCVVVGCLCGRCGGGGGLFQIFKILKFLFTDNT